MRKNEKATARRLQIAAVCCCLCLLAVGAGVTYRAFDKSHTEVVLPLESEQPVTAVQSPTIETARAEQERKNEEATQQETKKQETAPKAEVPAKEKQTEKPVFAYPLEGETKVVMAYSTDHAIYDPTLEQYRTNASVSLSAKKGTEVKAAADGIVKEIKKDTQAGNVVTIAHSADWLTTYGQLEDTVAVKEGESVKKGQTIGYVDTPTKYGVALGEHLDFAMEQNGAPQDPEKNLEKAE